MRNYHFYVNKLRKHEGWKAGEGRTETFSGSPRSCWDRTKIRGCLTLQGLFPLLAVPPCPSPPVIRNGQHDSGGVTEFIPGMSVKYHCDPGYVLTGKTTVSCLSSGVWSIPYPRCEGEQAVLVPSEERRALCSQTAEQEPSALLFPLSDHLQQPQHQGRGGGRGQEGRVPPWGQRHLPVPPGFRAEGQPWGRVPARQPLGALCAHLPAR